MYVYKKTYILIPNSIYGDNMEENNPILSGRKWETTLIYVGTLSIVFILMSILLFVIAN